MSKSPNSKNNDNPYQTSSCFNTVFQTIICGGNLPTNPSLSDQKLEKPAKIHPFTRPLTHANDPGVKSQAQVQAEDHHNNPGIIARLMGLESLPKEEIVSNNDMLFRSKSMNSLQFLPDFDPIRAAFHRRARTSASFHEQSHNKFLVKIDKSIQFDDDVVVKKPEVGFGYMKQRKREKKENEVVLKDECEKSRHNNRSKTKESGSKKSYNDECFTSRVDENVVDSSDCVREICAKPKRKLVLRNNKGKFDEEFIVGSTVSLSKKVDHKQEMCGEVVQSDDLIPSRSPVSVLEHHQEIFPSSKGEGRKQTSNAMRKSSAKSKLCDLLKQDIVPKSKQHNHDYSNKIASKDKLVKEEEVKAGDSSVELLGHIFKLAEDNIKDSKWVANYDVFTVQFVEDLCVDLGHEFLDLLLDELVDVITDNNVI